MCPSRHHLCETDTFPFSSAYTTDKGVANQGMFCMLYIEHAKERIQQGRVELCPWDAWYSGSRGFGR